MMNKRENQNHSSFVITFIDAAGNKLFDDPPILMIDGVIIKNASLIGNLNPDLVEKIDIVWAPYVVDAYLFSGIVNVITRSADFSSGALPASALRLRYKISEPVDLFISPEYSSQEKSQSRIPDFRNTMYWNPSLKPDKDGKIRIEFWTSDYATDYVINIQGLNGQGRPVSFSKSLKTSQTERR